MAGTDRNEQAAASELVAVVLAAGAGRRLRPLTALRPKPLCPVGNVALIDRALDQVRRVTPAVAVNLHHGRAQLEAHLDAPDASGVGLPAHRSIEPSAPLGTAGALGQLRSWIDGRGALVVNADTWSDADLAAFARGWDGERVRVLMTAPAGSARPDDRPVEFGPAVGLVASLLPWSEVRRLESRPSGLYEVMWRGAQRDGRLDAVLHPGRFADCGRPADYLRANALARDEHGGESIVAPDASVTGPVVRSVVGAGATVAGSVTDSVIWPGSHVEGGEHLVGAVRAGRLTVLVR